MMVRDSGWIQIFSENSQEGYDNMIQAIRIAEGARLPVVVTTDGFIISHGMERIEILDDGDVSKFIGEYKPEHYLLNVDNPITVGALDLQDYYFEHRRQAAEAMRQSKSVILDVAGEFAQKFGRSYGLFEKYKMDDAESVIVAMGSTAGTTKVIVDDLRAKGIKAGLLKPRVFRPFPKEELADALKGAKAIAVLDRSDALNGNEGPLCLEVKASLYDKGINKIVLNYIYGLGGREVKVEDIEGVYNDLSAAIKGKTISRVNYMGVRE
jgi:pyruvate ferredoxin oxidoreductase alpha subunit